tara:strand:+ start:260 stop:463 length:204 start_codon:yes stop_codon:yes gene_type:complete
LTVRQWILELVAYRILVVVLAVWIQLDVNMYQRLLVLTWVDLSKARQFLAKNKLARVDRVALKAAPA